MRAIVPLVLMLVLQGCTTMIVGTAVGTVATVAVETAKLPFKVAGAAAELASDDENDSEDE